MGNLDMYIWMAARVVGQCMPLVLHPTDVSLLVVVLGLLMAGDSRWPILVEVPPFPILPLLPRDERPVLYRWGFVQHVFGKTY